MFIECRTDLQNADGQTPLHLAAKNGHAQVTSLLIRKRANVLSKDSDGRTALHLAVKYGHLHVVQELLVSDDQVLVSGISPSIYRLFGNHEGISESNHKEEEATRVLRLALKHLHRAREEYIYHGIHLFGDERNSGRIRREAAQDERIVRAHAPNQSTKIHIHNDLDDLLLRVGNFAHKLPTLFNTFRKRVLHDGAWLLDGDASLLDDNERLLVKLASVNIQDAYAKTALHYASWTEISGVEAIGLLLENGAKVDICDGCGQAALSEQAKRTTLQWAVMNNRRNIVKLLVGRNVHGWKQNRENAMLLAMNSGNSDILQLLLLNGSLDYNTSIGERVLEWAIDRESTDILRQLFHKGLDVTTHNGQRALGLAVEKNRMDMVLLLVDQGVDVKTPNGQKALMLAVTQQDQHALKKLIKAGAEVGSSALRKALQQVDADACVLKCLLAQRDVERRHLSQALHLAATYASAPKARILIEAGANINAVEGGKSVLHEAVEYNAWTVVDLLGRHGVDVNAQFEGSAAIHLAVKKMEWKIVELLAKYGARLKIEDPEGSTPLQLATNEGTRGEYLRCIKKGLEKSTASQTLK